MSDLSREVRYVRRMGFILTVLTSILLVVLGFYAWQMIRVKFFPAEACGGLPYLKAIAAPYSMMRFIPTGGIEPGNLREYLAFPRIVACGGTWMVKADLLKNRDWAKVTELTRAAVALAQTPKA